MFKYSFVTIVTIITLAGCSPAAQPSDTQVPPTRTSATSTTALTYRGIALPLPKDSKQEGAPQPAWLVIDDQAIPATYAAYKTATAQVGPALSIPDIATAELPVSAEKFSIVIGPGAITKLEATMRQWTDTIIPLFDPSAQSLKVEAQSDPGINAFTVLMPGAASTDQPSDHLFQVITNFPLNSTQSIGEAHYVWRLHFSSK